MIEEFVQEMCDVLEIDFPVITSDTETFPTETTLAQYISKGNQLVIGNYHKITLELFFAIAHELRHAWQIKYHEDMLKGYKQADQLTTDEYNSQVAEIDAHAFAYNVMEIYFGVTPQFDNLSQGVKELIYERARKIEDIIS